MSIVYKTCAFPDCCAADRKKPSKLTYHRFPNNASARQKWVDILRHVKADATWEPRQNSEVCSLHFSSDSFDVRKTKRYLVPNAVPSLDMTSVVKPEKHPIIEDELTDTASENEDEAVHDSDQLASDIQTLNCPKCICPILLRTSTDGKIVLECPPFHSTPNKRPRLGTNSRKRLFEDFEDVSCEPQSDTPSVNVSQEFCSDFDISNFQTSTSSIEVTPKSRTRVRQEHNYYASPREAATELKVVKQQLAELKVKYRALESKLKRRDALKSTLEEKLEQQKVLSRDQIASLRDSYPHLLRTIIDNEHTAMELKGASGMVYDEEMKKFAATLHFYSPKAYRFIREYLTLPHPHTINSWMKSSNCGPGFNIDVISRLAEARSNDKHNVMTDVALTIDEMAIRVELVWNPSTHKYVGHIDYGTEDIEPQSNMPLASNALVCMVAGITGGWKVPLGYIFTDKTDSNVQKTFVDKGFFHLENSGFQVHSLTSDGNTANVALFETYGVVENSRTRGKPLTYSELSSTFPNPANPTKTVTAMYDTCHMIKLWRGTLAECGQLKIESGEIVDWKFIVRLHELQVQEKIRAANKLGRNHLEYQNHKMNVKLAVQSISKSNADAIVFCREKLKLDQFKGSEGTTYFMYLLDKVFDILNSRSPAQKGHKAPFNIHNYRYMSKILEEFSAVVLSMTYTETRNYQATKKHPARTTNVVKYLSQGLRKRAALGMVLTIKSTLMVTHHLLYREVNPIRFVMTYRFSQDLLELFFNKIRGRLGRNNNPNVVEFISSMKAVWHQNLLRSNNTGNCINQMVDVGIPGGLLPLRRRKTMPVSPLDVSDVGDLESFQLSHFSDPKFSPFYKNCLAYIAGNVVRVVATKIKCENCKEVLFNHQEDALDLHLCQLIEVKNRGGLFTPSNSVYKIVEITDSIYRQLTKEASGTLSIVDLDNKIFRLVVLKCLERSIFPSIRSHIIDFDPLLSSSHLCILVKAIVLYFLRIRLFDYGRHFKSNKEISTRHSRNKLTIFKGQ